MEMYFVVAILFALCAILLFVQRAARDASSSSNPPNVAASFNLQNYFAPGPFGVSGHINDFLLHPMTPIGPDSLIRVPEIFRLTVAINIRPGPAGGYFQVRT